MTTVQSEIIKQLEENFAAMIRHVTESNESAESCKSCRFSGQNKVKTRFQGVLRCHRYPPPNIAVMNDDDDWNNRLPLVGETSWCGEWQNK